MRSSTAFGGLRAYLAAVSAQGVASGDASYSTQRPAGANGVGIGMRITAWIAVLAAGLLVACAPSRPTPPAQTYLRGEVAAFLEQYLAAIDSRDAARIRKAYVTDDRFVWLEDGKVRYRQVDEVLASLAAFPPGSPIRTELTDLTVVPVGQSAAHAWASFKTTVGETPRSFSFWWGNFVHAGTRWQFMEGGRRPYVIPESPIVS